MLRIPGASSYEPSAMDRLWLLRAVQAEGAPRAAVAQVLVNGFAWNRAHGGQGSLASWVRSYSQPVNPRWAEGGDLLERAHLTPSEREAAIRRRALASSRTVFDRATHAAVRRALGRGLVDVPRSATDFAAPTLDATKKGYQALTPARPGVNRLWTRDPSWAGYEAQPGGTGTAALGAALLALALVLLPP